MGFDLYHMTLNACKHTFLIEKQDLVKHNEMPREGYPRTPVTQVCAEHWVQLGCAGRGAMVNVTSPLMDSKFLE